MDADTGVVVAEGRAPHEVEGTGGARETHPSVWWSALAQAMSQTGRAGEIGAISVAGQQHGMVVLGGDGRPLRPAPLWNDTRSAPDAAYLRDLLGGSAVWAERIGLVPVASFTVTKWAWLRRTEPEVAFATRAIRLPHDYLTGMLTGRGATDRGDASGTGWWSTATETYEPSVMDAVGLQPGLLPEVLGPDHPAGEVTVGAAAELGIPVGIPVGPGTGDNMGAALGLGLRPGVPVLSLGTSGTAYTVSTLRAADPSGTVAGFADASGRFLPLAATLNCTLAVDRVASWLGIDREAAAERTEVVMLPYLDGERTPNLPAAAGTITGLRHATEPEEILLAAYQGAVVSLLDALDHIDRNSSGIDPDAPLVLIGGGARGRTWRRVVGSLSGRSVQVPEAEELVALGAAAQAAAARTGRSADQLVQGWATRRGEETGPVETDLAALERIRRVRELTAALNGRVTS